jgi:hypothetical protein
MNGIPLMGSKRTARGWEFDRSFSGTCLAHPLPSQSGQTRPGVAVEPASWWASKGVELLGTRMVGSVPVFGIAAFLASQTWVLQTECFASGGGHSPRGCGTLDRGQLSPGQAASGQAGGPSGLPQLAGPRKCEACSPTGSG